MKSVIKYIICTLVALATGVALSFAHPAEKYALSSRLAEGKWGKVVVASTGMQFVSNSVISKLGLDPYRVNVYGYGGRQIPDELAIGEPDDLPLIPSVKVDGGIIFFGTDGTRWEADKGSSSMAYSHLTHPYSSVSYYFLSDSALAPDEKAEAAESQAYTYDPSLQKATTFWSRLLHETELTSPGQSGRILLGEDFRTSPSQRFTFPLVGGVGNARARIRFGAAVSGGNATIAVAANGKSFTQTGSDVIGPLTGDSQFLQVTSTVKEIPTPGASLNIDLTCTLTGVAKIAALDYIEVEYERMLAISGSSALHFYGDFSRPTSMQIEGCSAQTQIWDVTDCSRPVKVNYTLQGSAALFSVHATGLREFVAFNPSSAGLPTPAADKTVANQNIHALPNPDMVIIAPMRYTDQANDLADLHRRHDGMTVHVLTPEAIYNEFSCGSPDVGAFRKMLKMWADRAKADASLPHPDYCMIIGRATYDNKRVTRELKATDYPTVPIWQSAGAYSEPTSYCTDDYIGMTDDSDTGFDIGSQKIRTAVGRLPVRSTEEASEIVEKIKQYMERPNYGAWRNQVMIIADDQDNGKHLEQAEAVYRGMYGNGNGDAFVYEKLYLDSYPLVATATGDTYPGAKARMLQKWNEGLSWIQYIGHANPRGWGHEQLLTWTDINNLSNENLPFLFAATCSFAKHDAQTQSGAEIMLLNPEGGIIGTLCPARTVYIPQNGTLTSLTSQEIFARNSEGKARKVGDVMINGKNRYPGSDQNKLRFSLLSDPALGVLSPELKVAVESINGIDPESVPEEQLPVIGALGRVEVRGKIVDGEGNPVPDFNGDLHLTLFDAERVISTFGNGKDGVVSNYNDRKTKLFAGATKVVDGEWSIRVLMPAEIENNWSPAQFTAYAFSKDGREANGACDRLYVYGIDADAPDDTEGPVITDFALNDPSFAPGSTTHPEPLVIATVSDPAGINISEAGLGHRMVLTLDGSKHFDDVAQYYSPDPQLEGGGRIAYPLSGLAPGTHELTLTVWDNANNSSTASLPFSVGLNREVNFLDLVSDANPAHDKVTFTLKTDRIKSKISYEISVYTLGGHKVWSSGKTSRSRNDGSVRQTWHLDDASGSRVPRGLYLCRAIVESDEGIQSSKTLKLAVSAK